MLINMDSDMNIEKFERNTKRNKSTYRLIYIICISSVILYIFFYFRLLSKLKIIKRKNDKIINDLNQIINKLDKNQEKIDKNSTSHFLLNSQINRNEIFNEKLKKKIQENQYYFCSSMDLFFDNEIENKIQMAKAHYGNVSFDMYVFRGEDFVSRSIIGSGAWEISQFYILLGGLDYYSKKKKLPKKEITVLDIGANVGCYTFSLAKVGYELISFEVSRINSYILKKTFCSNKDINVTLINKGIGEEDEKCLLHHPSNNVGNGVILCGEEKNMVGNTKDLTEEVTFTKLSNYIPYLSKKNLALIKIDVEGSEGKVIYSGIELITKYHIPFLYIEFRNDYLKLKGTDPRQLLEMFVNNGYLLSLNGYFNKNYSSIDDILKSPSTDLYIVYSKFLQ